jgi:hypothetical protein
MKRTLLSEEQTEKFLMGRRARGTEMRVRVRPRIVLDRSRGNAAAHYIASRRLRAIRPLRPSTVRPCERHAASDNIT